MATVTHTFGSVTGIVSTMSGTADGNCRTGTTVDNTGSKFVKVEVSVGVKSQGTPTADTVVEVWGLRSDNDGVKDGNFADDTNYTITLRPRGGAFLGVLVADGSATPTLYGNFIFNDPGPKWNVLMVNRLGQTWSATNSDHTLKFRGITPTIA